MLTVYVILLSIPVSLWLCAKVIESSLFTTNGRGAFTSLSLLLALLLLSSDAFLTSLSKLSILADLGNPHLMIIGQLSSVFLVVALIVAITVGVQLSIEALSSILLGTPKREQIILNMRSLRILTPIALITLFSPLFIQLILVKLVTVLGVSV